MGQIGFSNQVMTDAVSYPFIGGEGLAPLQVYSKPILQLQLIELVFARVKNDRAYIKNSANN